MDRLVPLQDITVDQTVQARSQVDWPTVEHFATIYREDTDSTNGRLPPVSLIETDNGELMLADGFTRLEAARRSGIEAIPAIISQGTRRDAILLNITENARHGVALTIAERRRAACLLVSDDEWCKMSDREIGRHCSLDHKTVSALRREYAPHTVILPRIVHRGSGSFEMNVAKHASGEIPQIRGRNRSANATPGMILPSSTRGATERDENNLRKLANLRDQWKAASAQLDGFSQLIDTTDAFIRDRFLKDNPIATDILSRWRSCGGDTTQSDAAE